MATCRAAIANALAAFQAIAPGDDVSVDELNVGLGEVANLLLDLHDARGPMTDVDVAADYIASENQRVRIDCNFAVAVTLPNSILLNPPRNPNDYGFTAPTTLPSAGSIAVADGLTTRQPRDGTRIEIVGTTQALYFYRADLNAWKPATGLAVDDELPINNRLFSAFSAFLAERLVDTWPGEFEPSPGLIRRIAHGRIALFLQTGRARDPVMSEFL